MASSSKRPLRRTNGYASVAYHPTKGFRRISFRRVVAQGRMPHMIATWAKLGAAVL